MWRQNSKDGFSLPEVMVVIMLFSIILMAGVMVFMTGQNAYSFTAVRFQLLENARLSLQRISLELQESGRDSNGVLKVNIQGGVGVNSSDILRFSVPLCVCGMSPIDNDGNVSRWGAPMTWGQAGCSMEYTLNHNGKVDICHLPPGNPGNVQDISVSVNAVKAHLAHGDYLGDCDDCNPDAYTHSMVEYLMDNSGQLLRRVLDPDGEVLSSAVVSPKMANFQASLSVDEKIVSLSLTFSGVASGNRDVVVSDQRDVLLRNGG